MKFLKSIANSGSVFRISGVSYLVVFLVSYPLLGSLAQEENGFSPKCQPFQCGKLGLVSFPFYNVTYPECGFLRIDNCTGQLPSIQLGKDWPTLYVHGISQDYKVRLQDHPKDEGPPGKNSSGPPWRNRSCDGLSKNFTLSSPNSIFFKINQSLFNCSYSGKNETFEFPVRCNDSKHYILDENGPSKLPSKLPANCSPFPFGIKKTQKGVYFLNLFIDMFELQVTEECLQCRNREGKCQVHKENFHCSIASAPSSSELGGTQKVTLECHTMQTMVEANLGTRCRNWRISHPDSSVVWCIRCHKKKSASFNSRLISSDPSRSELEVGSVCFGVPLFLYKELAEATDNFSPEKELGDGGFGRVYYAKLQDGREVAVKRFHEHNYRKFEQFMNEIEILTRLRHKNLASLYGCTSRHSPQGLLLVYEFIPNGTVADHLRGGRAKPGSLPWPIRMNIAIETASALAYLHASDIIHRDVKTNNILLDNNFSVKVADFGLSRLFPADVTHVSTAPQGSPGYVDPEYHLCYQLTEKSDVYSFGVVLIELISSMPPVDMNRQKQEINLAYLAVNRIQNSAIEELIDPCLGFQSDEQVKRMTTSVAELAFLCLQQNKEMRPSMDVVLEELKRIQSCSVQHAASSPDCEVASLLKNVSLSSTSVTSKWVSSEITSSRSC